MSKFNRQNHKWLSQPIINLDNDSPTKNSSPLHQRQQTTIRPSGFLNAIDLLPLLQQQYFVKSQVQRKTIKSTLTLPPITERIETSRIQFFSSPQTKSENQIQLPQSLTNHRRNLKSEIPKPFIQEQPITKKQEPNDEVKKKVVFRKSIQVVDFINGIISRGEINDQGSKPLLRRQRTKILPSGDN